MSFTPLVTLRRSNRPFDSVVGLDLVHGFIYSESASTSLWYLYSYIALLLVMPFLRAMVKNLRHRDYIYLFFGYLTFTGILPCVELIQRGNNEAAYLKYRDYVQFLRGQYLSD